MARVQERIQGLQGILAWHAAHRVIRETGCLANEEAIIRQIEQVLQDFQQNTIQPRTRQALHAALLWHQLHIRRDCWDTNTEWGHMEHLLVDLIEIAETESERERYNDLLLAGMVEDVERRHEG